ncbi:MAG: head-tail adaptor protein [Pseudomonadota bacterium]
MKVPMLNRKFTLEAPEQTPDGLGGFLPGWIVLGSLWGELRGISGRDRDDRAAALSEARFRVTVRAAPAGASERPIPGQRLVSGTRIFPVLAVYDADPSGRWLTCYVREEAVR